MGEVGGEREVVDRGVQGLEERTSLVSDGVEKSAPRHPVNVHSTHILKLGKIGSIDDVARTWGA